jgi:hypothetical protein
VLALSVQGAERVMHLDFDAPSQERTDPGPRPPIFPDFSSSNRALQCSDPMLIEVIADRPNLRFDQGESLTLEAWVRLDELTNDQNMYILGKGRTNNSGFDSDNQNYALRLRGNDNRACLSFLFRSRPEGDWKGGWHRWTADHGFAADAGWHHVAVSYTFGIPSAIRAFVDGEELSGAWDMAGKTEHAPVVDADEVWIGGSMGRSSSAAFNGALDNVAIHRGLVSEANLIAQFKIAADALPPRHVPKISDGAILLELFEEGISANKWPSHNLTPSTSYRDRAFGLFRYPQKYIETGIRADRANPLLLHAHAKLTLPAGNYHLLIRYRNATRFYVDSTRLADLPFKGGFKDGHNPIRTDYLDLGPNVRWAAPGCQEKLFTYTSDGQEHVFRLETLIGGGSKSHFRPELGETLVAYAEEDSSDFHLLGFGEQVELSDAGWKTFHADRTRHYDELDRTGRAETFALHKAEWDLKHASAQTYIDLLPPLDEKDHTIDGALEAAFTPDEQQVLSDGERLFVDQVHPVLKEHCLRCHGTKDKGGLRLDNRVRALKGGASGHPAIVPGEAASSPLIDMIKSHDEDEWMPPKGERLDPKAIAVLEKWIDDGAPWAKVDQGPIHPAPVLDDLAFLRRVSLDTIGIPPSLAEIDAYLALPVDQRRTRVVDRLLQDPRWADHWTGYWQDVLAENPNLVKPSLNNTGPFRWWIYESLLDNKPMDMFVYELVAMKGSTYAGGPAGFKLATQNDVPMAAKANVLGGAFMGIQMKCARCHDAPYHDVKQRQLFSLAAMLERKPVSVPKSSSVPMDSFHGRTPKIQITMKPGESAEPVWLFDTIVSSEVCEATDARERLAMLLTAPQNRRFAQVMVNRLWKRYMGHGLVEPVDDWEHAQVSHPGLLDALARQFVREGYDQKHVARLILLSRAYQRTVDPDAGPPESFAGAQRRRLDAEQVVDSLHHVVGLPMQTEPITMDRDNTNNEKNFVHLGDARRGWMFTSLSNERDRPSLALPRSQAVVDMLTAFGWRPSRQEPVSDRGNDTNVIQPAIIANGILGNWLTRLSDEHELTALCLEDQPLSALIDTIFLRIFTRHPTPLEMQRYSELLAEGYVERRVDAPVYRPEHRKPRFVTWSNHLNPEANAVAVEHEKEAREAYPSTRRLEPNWRARMEDMVWALVNSPEMVYYP